jgi:heat shock protein HtpX
MAVVSYYSGSAILLQMSNARKIEHNDHPRLYNVVEEMTIAAGLPRRPDVYIIDENAMNAFATGRDPEHAAVAITKGLLQRLNRDELQGVIAHEIGHIRNRDILFGTVAGIMVGLIVLMCDIYWRWLWYGGGRRRRSNREGGQAQIALFVLGIVMMILAPILAQMLYFAFSRKREYLADATAAELTRYPEGLASALQKISSDSEKLVSASRATAPLYIVNPLHKSAAGSVGLFSTHPPIKTRIAVLRTMVAGASVADYFKAMESVGGDKVSAPESLLKESAAVEKRAPSEEKLDDKVRSRRQAEDVVKRLNQFLFLTCACGVRIKVPPTYKKKQIRCPKCGKIFAIPGFAAAAQSGLLKPNA